MEPSRPASPAEENAGAMLLEPLQRELLLEEVEAFAAGVADPVRRGRYEELRSALRQDRLTPPILEALQDLLELGLETGRFRSRYTAEGEQALLRLFRRTSRGAAIEAETAATNRALRTLAGTNLVEAVFTPRGPGSYALVLTTGSGRFTVGIDRRGVQIESVEVGT
jgi:hypothetical protein